MPNTMQERMEDLSIAYVQALCAKNGFSADNVNRDNDGVDLSIKCKGKPSPECSLLSPQINIQLKSSFSQISFNSEGNIKYILEVKNYNNLVEENRFIPSILVLLHLPDDQNLWVEHSCDSLKITKCAYWLSLKGREKSSNKENITITIPKENVLSIDVLKDLMIKAANRQEL